MRAVRSIVVAAVVFGAIAARADSAITGAGTFSCGQFADDYRKNPKLVEDLYYAWAQGFMGGLNWAKLDNKEKLQDLGSKPEDEQQLWLRNYCDRHPLAHYFQAVYDLYLSLNVAR